jgi:hypothetical protein
MIQWVEAQNRDEWFHQKKTKRKYLLEQIAALQVYLEYGKEGYEIAHNGLNTIQGIKKGDFDLHSEFFGSFSRVNPKIKNWARITDILLYQVGIISKAEHTIKELTKSEEFTNEEIHYCKSVIDKLLDECSVGIDLLFLLISKDAIELKDNERMARIESIRSSFADQYSFISSFGQEVSLLSLQRSLERIEINTSKILNGRE